MRLDGFKLNLLMKFNTFNAIASLGGFRNLILLVLIIIVFQGCSRQSGFEKIIGRSVVASHVESGLRFRREYYVYSRSGDDGDKIFNFICSAVSSEFNNEVKYDPGTMKFEKNKFGYLPDISRLFDAKYTINVTRYFSLQSKDSLSTVDVYESEGYVCVMLADGS